MSERDTAPEGREALKLRPAVLAFAYAMEERLRRHDATRGPEGWVSEPNDYLFGRLEAEVDELHGALDSPPCGCRAEGGCPHLPNWTAIRDEAADVGNFAMMLADASGALEGLKALDRRAAPPAQEDDDGCYCGLNGTSAEAPCGRCLAATTPPAPAAQEDALPVDYDLGVVLEPSDEEDALRERVEEVLMDARAGLIGEIDTHADRIHALYATRERELRAELEVAHEARRGTIGSLAMADEYNAELRAENERLRNSCDLCGGRATPEERAARALTRTTEEPGA